MPLDRRSKQYKQFVKINEKRIELIRKKFSEGLSAKEETQLKKYEDQCDEFLPPFTPEQWQKLRELELYIQGAVARNEKLKQLLEKSN